MFWLLVRRGLVQVLSAIDRRYGDADDTDGLAVPLDSRRTAS